MGDAEFSWDERSHHQHGYLYQIVKSTYHALLEVSIERVASADTATKSITAGHCELT